MMACYCCKAWALHSRARILAARRSFSLLSEWGRAPVRHIAKDGQSWFPCRAFAKITFVCWGIGGLSQEVRCNAASYRDAHIIGDALFPKGSLFSVAFLRWTWLAFSVVIRACVLLFKFGPLVLLYPFTYLSPSFMSLWIHLLLKVTESSGPTYIKLGQWASTRRDLFSEEFCVKFSKLHIKVIPHPWAYTEYSLGKAFGVGWERVFRFESQEPVGSGCIAQVYKAYMDLSAVGEPVLKELSKNSVLDSTLEAWEVSSLKGLLRWLWKRKHKVVLEEYGGNQLHHEDGFQEGASQNSVSGNPGKLLSSAKRDCLIPVAIKVLHPGLVHQVQMDLFLMKTGSRFLELLPGIKWLSLTEIVEEFEKLMIQQIDLHYEARNLENFRLNFRDVDYVKFPIPLHPFVTRNILVETFEESKPISQYLHTEATMELRQKIAKMGMDMLLKMVFVDNFVHADLHPGNILVQGGKCSVDHLEDRAASVDLLDLPVLEVQPSCSPLRLVVLDAGIIAALQGTDFANLRAVFTAVVLGQGERVAELILHHSRANRCKDVERFKADMAELVTKARHNTVALGKLQVASLLSSVFKLLMTHQVKLESNFASVIFAIMVLEGLGRSLDPELDILKAAKPFLLKPSGSLLE